MEYRFLSDCHTHSACSPCGKDAVGAMLARAGELGLYAWTLTDHCECQEYDEKYRTAAETAWTEMERAAERCPEGLRFYRGIELGQAAQDLDAADRAVAAHPYDFVIGSLHNLRGKEDFFYLDYAALSPEQLDELLTAYFEELLEMISWGGFDSLGHLTYPLRYIVGDHGIPLSMEPHREEVDEVLSALVKEDKALEVNTSGLRQSLGRAMPDLPILKRYRELGGGLVTLGSDAHNTADLGKGIAQGMEILKQAGFTEFAVYEKRRPVLLPLA